MKKIVCLVLVLCMLLPLAGCSGKSKVTINVLNWGDYIDPDLLTEFEEKTGIAVPAPLKPGRSKIAAECSLGKGHPAIGQSIQESLIRPSASSAWTS